jgi:hypothetical protein
MVVPQTRPCEPWPLEWYCPLPETVDQTLIDSAALSATHVLWALSGRRYGFCTQTVRPDAVGCRIGEPRWAPWQLTTAGWLWAPQRWCCNADEADPKVLSLWHYPVVEVTDVTIDGTTLAPSKYVIEDWRWLRRLDGADWPVGQDWTVPEGSPGTWSITYRWGSTVPVLGQQAAGILACEMVKASCGMECALPEHVTSVVRQGIAVSFTDPGELLVDGRTGLYLVDLFLMTVNPGKLRNRARVFRADERNDPGHRSARRRMTETPPVVGLTGHSGGSGGASL